MKRVPLRRGTKSLRRTSIKRKIKSEEQINDENEEKEKMWRLFEQLWNGLREKRCWNCNCPIYGENLTIYWDHCLQKDKYPELKFERNNLFFCCSSCHQLKGNGFPGEKHLEAINKAKEIFL